MRDYDESKLPFGRIGESTTIKEDPSDVSPVYLEHTEKTPWLMSSCRGEGESFEFELVVRLDGESIQVTLTQREARLLLDKLSGGEWTYIEW